METFITEARYYAMKQSSQLKPLRFLTVASSSLHFNDRQGSFEQVSLCRVELDVVLVSVIVILSASCDMGRRWPAASVTS